MKAIYPSGATGCIESNGSGYRFPLPEAGAATLGVLRQVGDLTYLDHGAWGWKHGSQAQAAQVVRALGGKVTR